MNVLMWYGEYEKEQFLNRPLYRYGKGRFRDIQLTKFMNGFELSHAYRMKGLVALIPGLVDNIAGMYENGNETLCTDDDFKNFRAVNECLSNRT